MKQLSKFIFSISVFTCSLLASGCLHYTMKESSIPKEVKTIRINFIENRARYVNPQLSPQLTDRLRQKVNNQTSRTLTQADADFDISGTITDYSFSTAAIADNKTATNRLNITVHMILVSRVDPKLSKEEDVTRAFDFDAGLSVEQAQQKTERGHH